MSKFQERLQAVRVFFYDVVAEAKRTNWPGRQELFDSTVVVVVMVLALGAYVGFCDLVLVWILKLLTP